MDSNKIRKSDINLINYLEELSRNVNIIFSMRLHFIFRSFSSCF